MTHYCWFDKDHDVQGPFDSLEAAEADARAHSTAPIINLAEVNWLKPEDWLDFDVEDVLADMEVFLSGVIECVSEVEQPVFQIADRDAAQEALDEVLQKWARDYIKVPGNEWIAGDVVKQLGVSDAVS